MQLSPQAPQGMTPQQLMQIAAMSAPGSSVNAAGGTDRGIPNPGGVDGGGMAGLNSGMPYIPPSYTGRGGGGLPDWATNQALPPGMNMGSMGGLGVAQNAGYIGQALSALTGVPGLSQLARYMGNNYIDNNVFMSPSFARSGTDNMIDSYLYGAAPLQSPGSVAPGPSYGPGGRRVYSGGSSGAGGTVPGSIKWRKRK